MRIPGEKISESEARELINERDLFGQVLGQARVEGGFKGFKEKNPDFLNIDEREEMEKVKKFQPEDMASFADELHTIVCEELGIQNPDQLKFYTAVGSNLDYGGGIDGFFELDLGNGKRVTVTLDGTESFYKMDQGKQSGKNEADVIFLWPQETEEENQFEWNGAIEKAAKVVVENLQSKVSGVIENLDDQQLLESEETYLKNKEVALRKEKALSHLHGKRIKKG